MHPVKKRHWTAGQNDISRALLEITDTRPQIRLPIYHITNGDAI